MDIIRKLAIAVRFAGGQCKVGQSECEMMTFNEKHHWVFPLGPTSCDYTKLNEYVAKLQNSKIEVLQAQWDFGENLSARQVFRAKTTIAR